MDRPHFSGPPPQGVPLWLWDATHELFGEMERIEGEAMNAGQVDQDVESHRYVWCEEVAKVIASRIADDSEG